MPLKNPEISFPMEHKELFLLKCQNCFPVVILQVYLKKESDYTPKLCRGFNSFKLAQLTKTGNTFQEGSLVKH